MVDFNKIREESQKRKQEELNKGPETKPKQRSWPDRVQHIIEHHLAELTTWEESFIYSQRGYIEEVRSADARRNKTDPDWDIVVSVRVNNKLKEIEDTYCTAMCHALKEVGK